MIQTRTPNFLCVGAQKAGTTSLHDILSAHPDICLSIDKETKFFFKDEYYNKGIQYYLKEFFKNCSTQKIIGEIDPEYMYFKNIPSKIFDTLGSDIKIVFMLRNPADRAYSHYLMNVRRGIEKKSFRDALINEKERIEKNQYNKNHFSYIDRGYYAKQINNYLKYFPIENMFFVVFEEDFIRNKQITIEKLLFFLGLNNYELMLDIKNNVASKPKINLLQTLLYSQSKTLKYIIKTLLPNRKLRKKIFDCIERKNLKPIKDQSKRLETKLKDEMIRKYFIEDIYTLEKLINRKLSIWINS